MNTEVNIQFLNKLPRRVQNYFNAQNSVGIKLSLNKDQLKVIKYRKIKTKSYEFLDKNKRVIKVLKNDKPEIIISKVNSKVAGSVIPQKRLSKDFKNLFYPGHLAKLIKNNSVKTQH